jgi:hypothetical protein
MSLAVDAEAAIGYRSPAMLPLFRKSAFVACIAFLSPVLAAAAETWDGSREGVLALRNGQILQGRITAAGDSYLVTLGESGELRIPTRDVEMHCLDLDEVYSRKRAALRGGGAEPHLELAEWCLRHSLPTRAADELLAAITAEPDHPRIRVLERRLQSAVSKPLPALKEPQERRAVVSLDELERTMRELPEGAVESFTAHVQPLLLNHCGANTCHGGRSESAFRLVRPSLGRSLTRRFTQRNVYAALQQVDKDCPQKSPLLAATSGPHGNVENVVFGEHDRQQFALLADWVKQVASRPKDRSPETITPGSPNLLQTSYLQPVGPGETTAETDSALTPVRGHSLSTCEGREKDPGARYLPRDPFDPEIFNRRFLVRSE